MVGKIEISGFADEIAEDLNKQIEVIKKLGISYIEMRGVNGKPLVEYSLEEVKEIKKQLDKKWNPIIFYRVSNRKNKYYRGL